MSNEDRLLAEKYRLLEQLGVGGMGTVHLAEDVRLSRKVAIKRLRPDLCNEHVIERLHKEARILAQINHSNIVQIYDIVEDDTGLALVMEYVPGQTLKDILRVRLNTPQQSLKWLIEIAHGLTQAHEQGIIHRDIKAENILIKQNGQVKITDFGIARIDDEGQTQYTKEAQILGSYLSLSPEQVSGKLVSSKSDVFSFGLLAYQMFTGSHPFGKFQTPAEFIHRILYENIIPLDSLKPELPEPLCDFIMLMLEKSPELRPSIQTVENSLRQFSTMTELEEIDLTLDLTDQSIVEAHSGLSKPAQQVTTKIRFLQHLRFNPRLRRNLALSSIFLGIVFVLGSIQHFLFSGKTPPRYVAVLPPELNNSDLGQQRYRHVVANIRYAIEQTLIESKSFSLIPERELKHLDKSTAEIGEMTGADIILQTSIECVERRCDVALSRIDKEDWSITGKTQWPILVDKSLNNALITRKKLADLIGSELPASGVYSDIDEENYRKFIDAYTAISNNTGDLQSLLVEMKQLMLEAPLFFPVYRAYSELTFLAYDQSRDEKYLNMLSDRLVRAEKLVPDNEEFTKIWLSIFLLKKDFGKAQAMLTKLERQGVAEDYILYYRGKMAIERQRYDEAVLAFSDAITLRPREQYFNKYVYALWMQGDLATTKKGIDALLALVPESEYAHAMLGNIAMLEGKVDEAIRVYERLVKFHKNSQNYSELGLAHLIEQNYETAHEYFIKALEYAENNPIYMLNIADTELLMGNTSSAKDWYNKIIDFPNTKEESIDLKFCLAQAYAHTQDSQKAIRTIQDLLASHPEHPNVLYTAALVYSVLQEEKTALVFVDRAKEAGISEVWFQLPFFQPLCAHPSFVSMFQTQAGAHLCAADTASN